MIDKLYGLQSTGLSLNERFTILASVPPPPKPQTFAKGFQNLTAKERSLVHAFVQQLQAGNNSQAHQRLGLNRSGSLNNLADFQRNNGFNQDMRNNWRGSNASLNNYRSVSSAGSVQSFNSFRSVRTQRRFRRRGGAIRQLRGRFRGGRGMNNNNLVTRVGRGGAPRAGGSGLAPRGPWRPRGDHRGRQRNKFNIGGVRRNQTPKPLPTKEDLDLELDQYMASTRCALDKELDEYMQNANDMDIK